MLYHLIKSQSVIKLYIFYNMLEVADRLFSAFGQDTIDALFWTATEPRNKKREHFGVLAHLIFAVIYVCILFNERLANLQIKKKKDSNSLLTPRIVFLNVIENSLAQFIGIVSSNNIKRCN